MIVGLVCARKNSEGLPGKNVRELEGVPLLERAIKKAVESKMFELVVVSTDIRVEKKEYPGACVCYLDRPKKLAGPKVSKWTVWQDALETTEQVFDQQAIAVCDIDVSRPLTTVRDVRKTVKRWLVGRPPVLLATCKAKKSPHFDIYESDCDGHLHPSKTHPKALNCRQDCPPAYEYGGICVIDRNVLKSVDDMWEVNVCGIDIDRAHCFDVDDELDWRILEALAA
jgi:CMP-N-acetylneuraminic acid synthetase